MAKYKRWEWALIERVRAQHEKPPHHAHIRLRCRGAWCAECGRLVAWAQLGACAGLCWRCWQAWQTGEVGSHEW